MRTMRALRCACLAPAFALFALLAFCVARRLTFPFELEWMEGATLIHVRRLVEGLPLYVRPSIDFVPFAYPPFYYYVCVPFVWLLGADFRAVRIVSVLATAATLLLVWLTVRRDAGRFAATLAAGVFAGCYALSDAWLDLGRVDSLYIALLAAVWFVASGAQTSRRWGVAGLLMSLAFLTKQPALLVLLPIGVYLLATDRRNALIFAIVTTAASAAVFLLLNWSTSGWYAYYVFRIPRLRLVVSSGADRLFSFWTSDLLLVAVALLVGIYASVRHRNWKHLALAGGCIGTSWTARMEAGAWNNAVLPAYLAAAMLFGLWLRPERQTRLALGITAAQLAMLLYDPRPFVPGVTDRAAGQAIVGRLRALPRPVLVVDHNSWSSSAGLPEHAHGWAMTDVLWADQSSTGRLLQEEVSRAIGSHTFGSIVTDGGQSWFQGDIEKWYEKQGTLVRGPEYRMRSGADHIPTLTFVPKRQGLNGLRGTAPERQSRSAPR